MYLWSMGNRDVDLSLSFLYLIYGNHILSTCNLNNDVACIFPLLIVLVQVAS
jgi:hypothetical protein